MSTVVQFDRAWVQDVRVDENGYVVMNYETQHRYEKLFWRHGIDTLAAMDTLDDFQTALARCSRRATIHKLRMRE